MPFADQNLRRSKIALAVSCHRDEPETGGGEEEAAFAVEPQVAGPFQGCPNRIRCTSSRLVVPVGAAGPSTAIEATSVKLE